MTTTYKDKEQAEFVAATIDATNGEPYAYECVDCHGFHVGIDTGAPWHAERYSCTQYEEY